MKLFNVSVFDGWLKDEGGRVMIYVRDTIPRKIVEKESSPNDIEAIIIRHLKAVII